MKVKPCKTHLYVVLCRGQRQLSQHHHKKRQQRPHYLTKRVAAQGLANCPKVARPEHEARQSATLSSVQPTSRLFIQSVNQPSQSPTHTAIQSASQPPSQSASQPAIKANNQPVTQPSSHPPKHTAVQTKRQPSIQPAKQRDRQPSIARFPYEQSESINSP